jgi:hypothetical protein
MDEHPAQPSSATPPATPQVGIFYVIDGALFLDCTPAPEAEPYGDFQTHPTGHVGWWPGLVRRLKRRPPRSYDYYPRGRVTYARPERRYQLYLDRCLLKEPVLVQAIIRRMALVDQAVAIMTDEHYQCAACNPDYVADGV